MTRTRCLLALLLGFTLTADASAQFLPVIGLPTVGQAGISFRIGGGNLRIRGFIPLGDPYPVILPVTPTPRGFRQVGPAFLPYAYGYPYGYGYPPIAPGFPFSGYGVIEQRTTIQIINPPGFAPGVGLRQVPDVSGIDLDLQPASAIWGEKPALAKEKGPAKNGEIAKVDPPQEKDVAANRAKAPEIAAAPKPEPLPDGQQLHDKGVAAFRNGDFGLAMARFRQAENDDKPAPRALFLRAQGYYAVGKYREAVETIQQGLQAKPDWPTSGFHPRLELYDKLAAEWKEQRAHLEQTHAKNRKNADLLFLLGYVAWFEGERDAAVDYFRQAQALAEEPRWADLFLRAAKN